MEDALAAEVRRLRTMEGLSVREIRARAGLGRDRVAPEVFRPDSLKRHRPGTVRRNTGEGCRGCLTVEVPRARQLYWKIEGIMKGMGDGVDGAGR